MRDSRTGKGYGALAQIVAALAVFCLISCRAQSHALAGRVLDAGDGSLLVAKVIVGEKPYDTDADGQFEIPLDPGSHQVQVLAPGYVTQSFTVSIDETSPPDSDQVVEVRLHRRVLSGVVLDRDSGQPVAGALLNHGQAKVITNQEGQFEVEARPQVSLTVSCPGYLPLQVSEAEIEAAFGPTGLMDGYWAVAMVARVLTGTVLEAGTARPLSGALVSVGDVTTLSDADGRYELRYVQPGTGIAVSSTAHRPASSLAYVGQATQDLVLDPWQVTLTILDGATGQPLSEARVASPRAFSITDAQGKASLSVLPGTPVTVTAEAYRSATLVYEGQEILDVSLHRTLTVELRDRKTDNPVSNALLQVFSGEPEPMLLRTDSEGRAELEDASAALTVTVKAPGYRRVSMPVTQTAEMGIDLEPFEARGVRVPFALLGVPDRMEALLSLVDDSELNAIVVDVKSDGARIAWPSALPLAQEASAYQKGLMDLRQFVEDCHKRGIYVIARMVVFKDHLLALARPEWALKWPEGQLYEDGEGLHWMDPFLQEVRDYNIALALEVANMGVDEIQFDYIRFPSSGRVGRLVYAEEWEWEPRVAAITEFCRQAYEALSPTQVFVSLDIFGLNVWLYASDERGDWGDNGIGQDIEALAPYMDYISPMLYPSLFDPGSLGYSVPALHPYEVIYRSLIKTQERIPTKVRPWLQHYSRGVSYDTIDFLKQKKAAQDSQTCGWLFWQPGGRYNPEVFDPKAYERYPEALVSLPKSDETTD
ncbi:MAG TPA: putative glycoside hydrolase [Anaerolineae bacterium]|nr:putative glycoside hydrolase [Anaerolineae bacterium]